MRVRMRPSAAWPPAVEAVREWETPLPVAPSLAGSVELTFDDGPDPVWTTAILAALRGSPLRATFFVIARRAAEHPEMLAVARADGHAIELHCYEHVAHTDADRDAIERDTERALAVLADLGVRPRRWRTPFGVHAPWTHEIAAEHDLELCGWDIDTNDWRGHRAERMLADAGPGLHHGAIVLLHDAIGPGSLRDGCEETVRFARLMAAEAAAA
jgi:peptidoglycan/xylan/chitin deacetylase (PgdA/CDA1 family)